MTDTTTITIKPSISEKANRNYLATIFKMDKVNKHPNADRLHIVEVNFTPVITANPLPGEYFVYFPTESEVNSDFLSFTNSYRDKELNKDKEAIGFFEKHGRVKTVKLRGEYSSGWIVPLKTVQEFVGKEIEVEDGISFDMLGDVQLLKKYVAPVRVPKEPGNKTGDNKLTRKLKSHNIVPGHFEFHRDTENLRHSLHKLSPNTRINVSYKSHGCALTVAKTLYNKDLTLFQKIKSKLGLVVNPETYYDYVVSSRKVIKNDTPEDSGFYKEDVWTQAADTFKEKLPEGWTVYAEIVGYTKSGSWIQKDYDYGCNQGEFKVMPYRISVIHPNGDKVELSPEQVAHFAEVSGLLPMPIFFTGTVLEHFQHLMYFLCKEDDYLGLFQDMLYMEEHKYEDYELYKETLNQFRGDYLRLLQEAYNEKDCYMCSNKVPEEGIVIRVLGDIDKFEAYKLKSVRFLEYESKAADKEADNLEG